VPYSGEITFIDRKSQECPRAALANQHRDTHPIPDEQTAELVDFPFMYRGRPIESASSITPSSQPSAIRPVHLRRMRAARLQATGLGPP
jgi:hypothetical protein